MMRRISSLSEKPVRHRLRILEAGLNPTGVRKAHSDVALFLHLDAMCLRESCIRENRPCSLSGGRRLARKRASSDPTLMKRGESHVTGQPATELGRGRQPAKMVGKRKETR